MVNDHVTHTNIANPAIDPKSVLVENAANTVNGPTSQQPSDSNIYARASNSPPMAVLPLNPSAKLDQEPNPFEQSFSSASKTSPGPEKSKQPKPSSATAAASGGSSTSNHSLTTASTGHPTSNEPLKLPPVAAMTSPAGPNSVISSVPKDIASQYAWDSLRTGPLSPSMLQRPTNPDDYAYSNINPSSSLLSYSDVSSNSYQAKNDSYYQQQGRSQPASTKYQDKSKPSQKPTKKSTSNKKNTSNSLSPPATSPTAASRRRKLQTEDDENDDDGDEHSNTQQSSNDGDDRSNKKPRTEEEDEKRKNFLERNRLAALKCRQRKKQWLNNLQAKVEYLTNDNEQLQIQTNALREEIVNLKTLLLAHKDCPISQANGFPKTIGSQHHHPQQQALMHGGGGVPNSGSVTSVPATTAPVSMASMYTSQQPQQQQPYNPSHRSQPQLPHPHQHRMSTSSTGSQPPSGLNMVMVSQHQGAAPPPPSNIQSSSGVIQF